MPRKKPEQSVIDLIVRTDIKKNDFRFGQDKAKDDPIRKGKRNSMFASEFARKRMESKFGIVRIGFKLV